MPPPGPAPGTPQGLAGPCTSQVGVERPPAAAGGMWEDLCFWAQQAAELAIEAVYQQHGWLFPFIHDLALLPNGLQLAGPDDSIRGAAGPEADRLRNGPSLQGDSRLLTSWLAALAVRSQARRQSHQKTGPGHGEKTPFP